MTHVILPGMVSRGKGIVVNISSVAGMTPDAEAVVYAANKVSFNLEKLNCTTVACGGMSRFL